MKKLIKDWWPLLLIAGWLLWKRHEKWRMLNYGQYQGSVPIPPPMPSQQRLIEDYIRQLEKAGYVPNVYPCHCGSTLYVKPHQYPEGYPLEIPLGGGIDARACTNPNCENFDHQFVLDY